MLHRGSTFLHSPASGRATEAPERTHSAPTWSFPRASSRSNRPRAAAPGPRGFRRAPRADLIGSKLRPAAPASRWARPSFPPLPKSGAAAPGTRPVPSPRPTSTRAGRWPGVAGQPKGRLPPAPEVSACALVGRERASGAEGRRGRGRGRSKGVPAPAPRRSAVAVTT